MIIVIGVIDNLIGAKITFMLAEKKEIVVEFHFKMTNRVEC